MSSYVVLARKYRPKTFDEVIGQEGVTEVLAGAIAEGRLGHAYLFAGPRGTGKTTTARILAKCLNCEQGPTATPCGTCDRCRGADEGSEVDIIELDAASHTGVDTIRELRDEVAYAPMRARHKVYIIDEVHMLSKAAFNALLKTLEEPPEHVVFLFATTEPHKVLDTILSRCQVLRLSPLSEERIEARLDEVFAREGVEAEPGVTRELARAARGGMRDALSMADKLLALAADRPTLADLDRLGGDGGTRKLAELLDALEAGDRRAVIELFEGSTEDEEQLAAGLLEALRLGLVAHHCGVDAPFLSAPEAERVAGAERSRRLGPERVELWISELLRARERMRLLPDQARLVLEATLLELARPETTIPLADLVARLEALEQDGPSPTAPSAPRATTRPADAPARVSRAPAAAPAPAASRAASSPRPEASPKDLADCFAPFLAELRRSHAALADLFDEHASADCLHEERPGVAVLRLGVLGERERKLVGSKRNLAACRKALEVAAGRPMELRVQLARAREGGPTAPVAPAAPAPDQQPEPRRAARGELAPEPPPAHPPSARTGGTKTQGGGSASDPYTKEVEGLFDGMTEDVQ